MCHINRIDFARNRVTIKIFRGITGWRVNATMCEPPWYILMFWIVEARGVKSPVECTKRYTPMGCIKRYTPVGCTKWYTPVDSLWGRSSCILYGQTTAHTRTGGCLGGNHIRRKTNPKICPNRWMQDTYATFHKAFYLKAKPKSAFIWKPYNQ